MTRYEFSLDTDRPMDPTGPADYVSAWILLAFYVFLGFFIMITAKASTQARVSLALKDPFWINIMYMGSFLAATSLFISNKHLDVLDPVRNVHCSAWDFWGLMGGFTLWIAFWISSLVTNRIRQSGFSLTATSQIEYREEDIVPTFTYEHEMKELRKSVCMEEHDEREEGLIRRQPSDADTGGDGDGQMATVDLTGTDGSVPDYYNFSRDNSNGVSSPCSCLCAPCRAVSERVSRWWWTRTTINTRLAIFRTSCVAILLTICVVVCCFAEVPGVTTFHSDLNACISNFYYKTVVVSILIAYMAVCWGLYFMMTRKTSFLPSNTSAFLFSTNYRNALLAMTVALSSMICLNMFSLLSFSVVRSVDFLIFIALLVYSILQMMGTTAWECLRGTYVSDREIEENLKRLELPRNFTDIVSDSAYAPVLNEFYKYVRAEERGRMYLVDRWKLEYQGRGPVVVLPGYVCRWDPSENRYANADQNYPLFLDIIVDLHEAIWARKRKISNTAGQLASTLDTDRSANEIFDAFFKTKERNYEVLCHEQPQRIETFKGMIPAFPISEQAAEHLADQIRFRPMDLALFQDVSEYLDNILQTVCWSKFFNDGRTMRHLREASVVQMELIHSLSRAASGSQRGIYTDIFGQDVVQDRSVMAEMPNYYDRPSDSRPPDLEMAQFVIEDEEDEQE